MWVPTESNFFLKIWNITISNLVSFTLQTPYTRNKWKILEKRQESKLFMRELIQMHIRVTVDRKLIGVMRKKILIGGDEGLGVDYS